MPVIADFHRVWEWTPIRQGAAYVLACGPFSWHAIALACHGTDACGNARSDDAGFFRIRLTEVFMASIPRKHSTSSVKDRLTTLLAVLLVVCGATVFAYPTVSNLLASRKQTEVVESYRNSVTKTDKAKLRAEWGAAKTYNENLNGDPLHDPFVSGSGYVLPTNYASVLNVNHDGVMGYLDIKRISLRLPIYHGVSEDVLSRGVGHLRQTALPIGGKGSRPVLAGHRGLPSAELFTRLGEMRKGDLFWIDVLDRKLTYKVVDISVIEPEDLDELKADPDRDLVTLLTCTPYGKNTHRLLVTGERTAYVPEDSAKAGKATMIPDSMDWWVRVGLLAGGVTLFASLGALAWWKRRKARDMRVRQGFA